MNKHAAVTKCGFPIKQVKVWMKDYNIICVYINYKCSVDTSADAQSEDCEEPAGHSWLWTFMTNWSHSSLVRKALFLLQVQLLLCEEWNLAWEEI